MKPQSRPHHYAPRRRGWRGPLSAGRLRRHRLRRGVPGIAFPPVAHRRPGGELPEDTSSSQGESSTSSLNQITVTPTAEPSLSPEERPWYLRLVNKDNPLPQDFTVEPDPGVRRPV